MPLSTAISRPVVLWQGFSHRWGYNHRVNRIGCYIEHTGSPEGAYGIDAVHTAASGTGPDRAEFVDPFFMVQTKSAAFQAGTCQVKLTTTEEQLTPFRLHVRVGLGPSLAGKDTYTVVLNGFDLVAEGDAKKLMTLVLGVTDPEPTADRRALSFSTYGAFRVDCSTPECDRKTRVKRSLADDQWKQSVQALRLKISQDLRDPKRTVEYEAGTLSVVGSGVPSLADRVQYVLRVRYLIIAGNSEDLYIAQAEPISHSYTWDRKSELPSSLTGRAPIHVSPVAGKPGFDGFAFAFQEFAVTLYRKGTAGRLLWRQDIAMHLLEWNMRIWEAKQLEGGLFSCTLDLFFKNWDKRMRWRRLPYSLFAYRDAGEAQFGAQLTLLQFKTLDLAKKDSQGGSIDWLGGNREATTDPAAIHKRRLYASDGQAEHRAGNRL
jgi:hypothetical protein